MPTPYFSALHRFLSSRMGNSATPDQVKGMGAFFSPEERHWTGFDEHVANAGPKVYKQQLLDHMASKMPQIEPAVKGEKKTPELSWHHANLTNYQASEGFGAGVGRRPVTYKVLPTHDDTGRWYVQHSQHGILRETDSSLSNALLYPTREAAMGGANQHYAQSTTPKDDPVKFKEHIVPGGKNYRENVYQWNNNPGSKYTYKTHWDESNPLFHTRTTERSFPGGKSLHLEEVQSDWHQQARHKINEWTPENPQLVRGYRTKDREVQRDQIKEQFNSLTDEYLPKLKDLHSQITTAIDPSRVPKDLPNYGEVNQKRLNTVYERPFHGETVDESKEYPKYNYAPADALVDEHNRLWNEYKQKKNAITQTTPLTNPSMWLPDAPHKTSWHELALRTALHDAAQKGKTHLTWSTGDHNAGHYSLDKHVDTLRYDPDTKTLVGRMGGDQRFNQTNVHPNSLSDYVGDETAQKLLDSPRDGLGFHELTGQSLKVGGKGMKGFYGSIDHDTGEVQHGMLSQYANKLAKKLHGGNDAPRSEVINQKARKLSANDQMRLSNVESLLSTAKSDLSQAVPGTDDHFDARDRVNTWGQVVKEFQNHHGIQHGDKFFGIKITPQMRERILSEGVPLWGDVDSSIRKGLVDKETTIFPDIPLMQSYLVSGYEEPRPVVIRVK